MKPSQALRENRKIVNSIISRYPMFSNIRIIGSIDRLEDDEFSDIDLYLDADSTATLLDIARLQNELEEVLLFDVDIFSSNFVESRFFGNNNRTSNKDGLQNE